jgi:uncharacterized protein YcbK (DUF882 family)
MDFSRPARRRFLGFGMTAGLTLAWAPARAALAAAPRSLQFESLHTGERLRATYWAAGAYVPEELRRIDHVLRDHRTGDVRPIDPGLLDLLCVLRDRLGTDAPFQIISAYRSPATNAMLAEHSSGVARQSLHTKGLAIDIRVPGRSLVALRDAALGLKGGGVGFYPRSDFVHVDIGRVRSWGMS